MRLGGNLRKTPCIKIRPLIRLAAPFIRPADKPRPRPTLQAAAGRGAPAEILKLSRSRGKSARARRRRPHATVQPKNPARAAAAAGAPHRAAKQRARAPQSFGCGLMGRKRVQAGPAGSAPSLAPRVVDDHKI